MLKYSQPQTVPRPTPALLARRHTPTAPSEISGPPDLSQEFIALYICKSLLPSATLLRDINHRRNIPPSACKRNCGGLDLRKVKLKAICLDSFNKR